MKLRPDLQALVDAELERRRRESAAISAKYGSTYSEVPYGHSKPRPVEPEIVPGASPLIDAVNVQRALQAHYGSRVSAHPDRGQPWPVDVPFPYERVVAPEIVRQRAEDQFASASSAGERQIMAEIWGQSPWLVKKNFGGLIDWPGWGAVVKESPSGKQKVLGFGEVYDQKRGWDTLMRSWADLGRVDVGAKTYRVRLDVPQMYFEYDGNMYETPVWRVSSEVRK